MAKSFRAALAKILVPWLANGEGGLAFDALGQVIDAYVDRWRQGIYASYPSLCQADALPLIGADRLLPRGPLESEAHYRTRLQSFRYPEGHSRRGLRFPALEQLRALSDDAYEVQSIDRRGNRATIAADGTRTLERGLSWDWDGVAASPNWARAWWLIKSVTVPYAPHGLLFDSAELAALWTLPGATLSTAATYDALEHVRNLAHLWKMGGSLVEWLIFTTGSPAPGGTWASWRTRDAGLYWLLEGSNTYQGVAATVATYSLPDATDSPSAALLNTPLEELADAIAEMHVAGAVEVITSAGAQQYVIPAGARFGYAVLVGGGGGGGGATAGVRGGGGGGAGAVQIAPIPRALFSGGAALTLDIVVGAGGGGAAVSGTGTAGGATTLTIGGRLVASVAGGAGGAATGVGGAGGTQAHAITGGVAAAGGAAHRALNAAGGGGNAAASGVSALGPATAARYTGLGYGAGGAGGCEVGRNGGGGAPGWYHASVGGAQADDTGVGLAGMNGAVIVLWG